MTRKALSIRAAILLYGLCSTACAYQFGGMTPTQAFSGIDGQLVEAAVDGNGSQIERLVKQGANPNSIGAQGSTPLMWAIGAHSHLGVQKLLELGADPNAPVPVGGTATRAAARGNDDEILELLLKHGGNTNIIYACKTSLMAAIDAMNIKRIDLLLAYGAYINGEACNSSAPDIATAVGRFDLVLYMLSKGYSNNLDRLARSANNRFVPKDSQAYQDKQQVLDILRQRGAMIPSTKQ